MRRSPGSPSQMIAALLRRAVRMWRSRQLTLALIFPPTNHFACGGFHSSTRRPRLDPLELARELGPERLGSRPRARRRRDPKCWLISEASAVAESAGLPGGDCLFLTWSLGHCIQRGDSGSNRRGAIRVLGAGVLEKEPVMLHGSRPFVGVVVQLAKIVMRGRIPRGDVQHTPAMFLSPCRAALTYAAPGSD